MREETEYSDSHFEGSINIPVSKNVFCADNTSFSIKPSYFLHSHQPYILAHILS